MIKLYILPWYIKLKVLSYIIIDKQKENLNTEVIMFHTQKTVREILDQIIENVIQELM
tara:strand:+ start:1425 stop:1598 length:174 start_codon:yes stop_codon:yes gene_type:complete